MSVRVHAHCRCPACSTEPWLAAASPSPHAPYFFSAGFAEWILEAGAALKVMPAAERAGAEDAGGGKSRGLVAKLKGTIGGLGIGFAVASFGMVLKPIIVECCSRCCCHAKADRGFHVPRGGSSRQLPTHWLPKRLPCRMFSSPPPKVRRSTKLRANAEHQSSDPTPQNLVSRWVDNQGPRW